MAYRTTKQADQDIIGIYVRGTTEFGVAQSDRYVEGLFSTFELLAENPHIAREHSELNPPMRLKPYGAHVIAYMLHGGGILIVRVLHGRRDWQSLLS